MSKFVSQISDPEVKAALDAIDLSKATIEVTDSDIQAEYELNESERFYRDGHRNDFNVFKQTFNR